MDTTGRSTTSRPAPGHEPNNKVADPSSPEIEHRYSARATPLTPCGVPQFIHPENGPGPEVSSPNPSVRADTLAPLAATANADGPPPFPLISRAVTSASTRPYSSFSHTTKWMIVILAGSSGILSPISSNIFVPAIPLLAREFHKGEEEISLGVTIYLIFQAITPSFFGSLSDSYGRRPVYVATLSVYFAANIGLACCPTSAYWLLLVLRALQATGGSAVISIGAGTVGDIAEPRERGTYMALFQGTSMFGPAFGPLLGGVFAETLGWRAIFWFLTIATGVILVPIIFFMPETLRSLVGDGSIPPPPLNMSLSIVIREKAKERHLRRKQQAAGSPSPVADELELETEIERPPRKPYQPLSAFMIILTNPEITMTFVFTSLMYMEYYCVLTVFSTALQRKYGLSELKIGLCYLPVGIASAVTSILSGRYNDYLYQREEKRVGGDYRKKGEEFRIERARLTALWPLATSLLVAATALGWCLQTKAPLPVTLIVAFVVGLGANTNAIATLYAQDLLPGKGGACSASLNLIRCLFAAVGTSVIQIMYSSALGAGWSFVVLTGICVLAFPFTVVVVWRHGRQWRERRRRRRRAKKSDRGVK